MNAKVYVDNLAAGPTERDLKELFSVYGNVVDVNIAIDSGENKYIDIPLSQTQ